MLQKLLDQLNKNLTSEEIITISSKIHQEITDSLEGISICELNKMNENSPDLFFGQYHLVVWNVLADENDGIYCRVELWDNFQEYETDGFWFDVNFIPIEDFEYC